MPETPPRTLNHFCLYSFTDAYWMLNVNAKAAFHAHWLAGLTAAAVNFDIYQNTDARGELLVWSVLNAQDPASTLEFFEKLATITTPYRHLIQPVDALWGFTRRNPGAGSQGPEALDPFAATRMRYLMAYAVAKAAEWQLVENTGEQPLQTGQAYEDIRQLLLYSFGLEDRRFVVVYEADDLVNFSRMVNALRDSEAKHFSLQDAPAYTAVYHPAAQTLALWK